MKNEQHQFVNNENKGRGLFYGIIAAATFIIMAVGATFAYFTATTNSMNSAVNTGSATLQLGYISFESAWSHNDLIPADTEVVEYSFEYQDDTTFSAENAPAEKLANTLCKDDYGNSICSVYLFQVINTANSPQNVSLDVLSEINSFASLNAMVYAIDLPTDTTEYDQIGEGILNGTGDPKFKSLEEDTCYSQENPTGKICIQDGNGAIKLSGDVNPIIYINRKGVQKRLLTYLEDTNARPSIDRALIKNADTTINSEGVPETVTTGEAAKTRVADSVEIGGGTTKTFALVLYIKNAQEDQTATDAAKSFTGTMIVSSGDGSSGVSGSIGGRNQTLQSDPNFGKEPEPTPEVPTEPTE